MPELYFFFKSAPEKTMYSSLIFVTYRYSLEDTDFFTVDESSGLISTRKELDRESVDLHVFRVVARDSSEFLPLTGTATVTVRVTDVNDNRPVFENSGSNDFFIPTGVREGDFILGVSGIRFSSVSCSGPSPKISDKRSPVDYEVGITQILHLREKSALNKPVPDPYKKILVHGNAM